MKDTWLILVDFIHFWNVNRSMLSVYSHHIHNILAKGHFLEESISFGGFKNSFFLDRHYCCFHQIPVNKVRTFGDLRNVLMKRIFLSALHFRINTRYQVRWLLPLIWFCVRSQSMGISPCLEYCISWCTIMVLDMCSSLKLIACF